MCWYLPVCCVVGCEWPWRRWGGGRGGGDTRDPTPQGESKAPPHHQAGQDTHIRRHIKWASQDRQGGRAAATLTELC